MTPMKTLLAASALALAGSYAFAQTTPAPTTTPTPDQQSQPAVPGSGERSYFDALTDARMAAIPAGLKLTPEQQQLWAPVEQAMRAMAAARAERWARFRRSDERQERQDMNLLERVERRSELATRNAENLRAFATALRPFWTSLDERQKRLLPVLMRPVGGLEGRRRGWRERHMMDRDRMMRRGIMERRGMMERGDMMDRGRRMESGERDL